MSAIPFRRLGRVLRHVDEGARQQPDAAPYAALAAGDHSTPIPIKIGVVGAGRGKSYMDVADAVGFELVAVCDNWQEKLDSASRDLPSVERTYSDYTEFLAHPGLQAVVLCNFFHEHAPFAIQALDAGLHVMSECAACHTLAEGVALTRAVEASGKIYMLAENYPYMAYNQEMKRLFEAGEIGEFKYGEGCDDPQLRPSRRRRGPPTAHLTGSV